MKSGEALLVGMAVVAILVIPADVLYTSRFLPRFKELEKERIITSNQLATAKIVSENLNHVRDLVFHNMDFAGHKDSVTQESILFEFLTLCVNDLKLKLISIKPSRPNTKGRVTTYGYDIMLEGDFFSFGELCSKFENSRRVMAITYFEMVHREKLSASSGNPSKQDAPQSSGRKGVSIKMHLDTFRVRKG